MSAVFIGTYYDLQLSNLYMNTKTYKKCCWNSQSLLTSGRFRYQTNCGNKVLGGGSIKYDSCSSGNCRAPLSSPLGLEGPQLLSHARWVPSVPSALHRLGVDWNHRWGLVLEKLAFGSHHFKYSWATKQLGTISSYIAHKQDRPYFSGMINITKKRILNLNSNPGITHIKN